MAVRLTLSEVEKRAQRAVSTLSEYASVVRAFLFGSYLDGRADEWSDIDIGVFIEGLEKWDIKKELRTSSDIRMKEGYDIELHFFPAQALTDAEPASFAAYVIKHGRSVKLTSEQVRK
ncbi:MAG: nucleotidyltransferase domain-containing protein [Candidatus Hatepunaea meridiana]|nr:nucleotidyltransferase domain-containing protein [Candidatus Hatepunaea meridiana]